VTNVIDLGMTEEGQSMSAFMGSRLRERREAAKLTQQELAERIGVRKAQISLYEHHKTEPGAGVLANMSKELGVSTDYLLGLVDTPNEQIARTQLSSDELYILNLWRNWSAGEWMKIGAQRAIVDANKPK
jgi:transcriptional regulator with XRE-family HTH domain